MFHISKDRVSAWIVLNGKLGFRMVGCYCYVHIIVLYWQPPGQIVTQLKVYLKRGGELSIKFKVFHCLFARCLI